MRKDLEVNKSKRIGKINISNEGYEMKIIKYYNCDNIWIEFQDEYKAKIDERQQISDLDQAEQYIDQIMAEHFQGIEYMIMKNENGLAIVINIPDNDIAFTSIEEWNELVGIMVDYDIMIQQFLQECGLNVPTATMVADIESDIPLLAIVNGEVMYDIFNGIDRLN